MEGTKPPSVISIAARLGPCAIHAFPPSSHLFNFRLPNSIICYLFFFSDFRIFSRGILSRRSLAKTKAQPYRTTTGPTS